jgi:hypothetical protein
VVKTAVALHFMYYNFCRVHQTLRVTPAMEAGHLIARLEFGGNRGVARRGRQKAA